MDILAVFVQLTNVVVIFIPQFHFLCKITTLNGSKVDTLTDNIITECINGFGPCFLAFLAISLSSLAWWENFLVKLDEKEDRTSCKVCISSINADLKKHRAFIIFVSLLKILTSFIVTSVVAKIHIFEPQIWGELANQIRQDGLDILLLVISSFVCYYIACLACKLQMQIISFAIPCFLSTPIASGLMAFLCQSKCDLLFDIFDFDSDSYCDANYLKSNYYYLVLPSLLILSLYWTARHICFPTQERIAQNERCVLIPLNKCKNVTII